MKHPNVLLIILVVLVPLLGLSCSGTTQISGGWSGVACLDGVVYAGTRDGRLVAVNSSTGTRQWDYDFGSVLYATPLVSGDSVYVATYSGKVYALSTAERIDVWVRPTEGRIGPVVASPIVVNGTLYVSSSDGMVYAFDTSRAGAQKWKSDRLADKLWTSPAVVGDTLYVSTFDGRIHALSTETGDLLDWSFQAEAGFASSPLVYERTIYVGSFDRHLYAIERGGNASMWRFPEGEPAGNWFWACPIVKDGVVYAGCLDGRLYAINATTGRGIWSYMTTDKEGRPSPIVSPPVLVDNALIVVNESGTVHVFDLNTGFADEVVPAKRVSVGASVRSPFCAQDGLVYVRTEDNSLYAVDIDRGMVAEGWPISLAAEK